MVIYLNTIRRITFTKHGLHLTRRGMRDRCHKIKLLLNSNTLLPTGSEIYDDDSTSNSTENGESVNNCSSEKDDNTDTYNYVNIGNNDDINI